MYEIPTLEVYLDILFLLNFIMDYFIFWIVSKITYQKTTTKRLCIGSLIGAGLYCLVVITPFLRVINIVTYLVILPLIPIKIIFKPKKIKSWVQIFIIANITALAIGGMSYGLLYWVQEQKIVANIYKKTYENFSIWILLVSTLGSYVVIQIARYYMQKRNPRVKKLYSVRISFNKQIVDFETLLDTGNKVYDPLTKDPVIIVEYKILKQLLPLEIRTMYEKTEIHMTSIVQEVSSGEFGTRIRLIPYHSLGNPNGILLGFKPDGVYIGNNGEDSPIENVVIGIYQHNLSSEDTYHGLLHEDLLK
ncbi:MAG TPA: sigma-E processing peptidase SpoIIGA [Epulopiscium sp.]|nr:sigma-E processing peptidase SpoIIGA [Candidatus Epulonipiscium sp.]